MNPKKFAKVSEMATTAKKINLETGRGSQSDRTERTGVHPEGDLRAQGNADSSAQSSRRNSDLTVHVIFCPFRPVAVLQDKMDPISTI